MKKRFIALGLCLALAAASVGALAAGDASDPLVSLAYLTGAFTDRVDAQVDARLDAAETGSETSGTNTTSGSAELWTQTRLKNGDVLTGSTGTNVLVLAGGVSVTFSAGTVVDVTTGSAVASGAALVENHRYLVAEDTTAAFTVTGKTAVVEYQGPYAFTYSAAVDQNAMAAALKALHLFQGSLTGYGQGFDLEKAPTRLQALIMFIRVLGEEEAALAWTGSMPFTDVPLTAATACYVGYAYEMGYTNGFTATTFAPARTITANQYVEFMLRALGHSSTATTNLSDALDRAWTSGLLSAGEVSMLQSGAFLRADLVYISYYALEARTADGAGTLADALQDKGIFTARELSAARAQVTSARL